MEMKEPEVMIPFQVKEKQAIRKVRRRTFRSIFLPFGFLLSKVSKIQAVYLPFWIFNLTFEDNQRISAGSGRNYFARRVEVRAKLRDVPIYASTKLNQEFTQALEPYDLKALIPYSKYDTFGCYSSVSEQMPTVLEKRLKDRCSNMISSRTESAVGISARIEHAYPRVNVTQKKLAMFPVWIIIRRFGKREYPVLVNGQTAKIVTVLPYSKTKVFLVFFGLSALFMTFIPRLYTFIVSFGVYEDMAGFFLIFWVLIMIAQVLFTIAFFEIFKEKQKKLENEKMKLFLYQLKEM